MASKKTVPASSSVSKHKFFHCHQQHQHQPKKIGPLGRSIHINDLPDEILDSIFEYAVLADQNENHIRATLRVVCKQWNTVVLGNPGLWTRIDVGVSVAAMMSESECNDGGSTSCYNSGTCRNAKRNLNVGVQREGLNISGCSEGSGKDRSKNVRGFGLGSMPPLEFVRELFERSGELNILLGMTVYDLDADTVMVRPVKIVEGTQGDEDVWSEDEDEDEDDFTPPRSPPSTAVDAHRAQIATPKRVSSDQRLSEYFRGLVIIISEHIHRFKEFHLYFVSEHTSLTPSTPPRASLCFPSLIALLPLSRGYNLHNVCITSHLIQMTNSHTSTHTANHHIFNSLVCSLPPNVRRLSWIGNTPNINFRSFKNLKYLDHIDVRGVLSSYEILGIFEGAHLARTIQLQIDSVHAGFVIPSGNFTVLQNIEGLTIKSGLEVYQVLGMCVKMPRLGICCIEIPHQVPKEQWPQHTSHNPPTAPVNGQVNNGGGVTIRNAWEWLCAFLERCPKLKVLQLYDPHGAIPIDMIKDLVCAVKNALGVFIITPAEEWMKREEVDDTFWKTLKEVRHPREDEVRVSTVYDDRGKPWNSIGWFVEPCAEEWLRSSENGWLRDTGFRWEILD